MKILQITAKLPYPPEGGGRIEIFNSIKYLHHKHQITLLSLVDEINHENILKLKKYCKEVIVIPHDYKDSLKNLFLNLFSTLPYTIVKYRSNEMEKVIQKLNRIDDFDLVRIDSIHMAYYLDFIIDIPAILRAHNVESVIMYRFFKNTFNPLVKIYALLQWRKLKRYERMKCQQFSTCIMISAVDEETLKSEVPAVNTKVVTAGVDTEYFFPDNHKKKHPNQIVFTGDMAWRPNDDAVIWFCKAIFHKILNEIPDAVFYIVGRNPSKQVRNLQSSHVIVTGRVEDVRPFMRSSAVFVVPLRVGGGIRLKILEAMAMGLPVVTTSVGCEGIRVIDKRNVMVADDAHEFTQTIIKLMKNKLNAEVLSKEGLKLINSRYSWQTIARQFDDIYHKVARKN